MRLEELIAYLDRLDDDQVICVMRPWTPIAEATLIEADAHAMVHAEASAGFAYFLEVHVAKEAIGVFGDKPATLNEKVRLLLEYAENDAYPDWVYRR